MTEFHSPRGLRPARDSASKRGAAVVSWVLLVMGLAAFAPCVLLPEWQGYQALRESERAELERLDSLQGVVDRERRLLNALQSDQGVIARAAQRELAFHRVGDREVRVAVTSSMSSSAGSIASEAVAAPLAVPGATALSARSGFSSVFCDDQTRVVIMIMSVSLMLVAMSMCRRGAGDVMAKYPG